MRRHIFFVVIATAVIVTSAFQPLSASPKRLTDFVSILDSLKQGYTLKAVIYYKECQLISDNEIEEKSVDAIGGMELSTYEYFAPNSVRNKNGFISSSKTILINHPRYGYVLNYAKIRIYDNNKIRIITQYVDPKTYEIKMNESFYTTINNTKTGGAHFFRN